jgi:gluconolactonase
MKPQKLLLGTFLLLGFGFIGLHAQVSRTDIIPIGSSVTKLSSNQFKFTEAPVWYGDSVLLFTDDGIRPPNIFKYNPIGKQFSIFLNYSVDYNGLTCDKTGNLLACESDTKSIVMMNNAGAVIKSLTGIYNGKTYNGPNDLIADDKGGVYFTDPVFLGSRNQDKEAVYYIDPTGNVKRVIDDLAKPNGILLSPDGTKLYVVDTENKYVYSWDVASDGSISDKSNLALLHTTGGVASGADGMAIDIKGNIYVASDLGIQIFSPEGAYITKIAVQETPSNCDFGGKDFKTLYITAYKNLYSIDLNYPGYAVSKKTLPDAMYSLQDKPMFEIYPNPASDKITIETTANQTIGELSIFNINRQDVITRQINGSMMQLDISNLSSGIYFVRLTAEKEVQVGKFVKQF